jgi:protein-disulfide isomerase
MTSLHRLAVGALAVLLCGSTGCSSDPAPEQLQRTLVEHPEVLYAVVRAHPKEFLDVLTAAAKEAQGLQGAQSARDDSLRIEEGLRSPKTVDVSGRAGFGNPDAPITVIEYTDFECPFCRQERDVLVELLRRHPKDVRLVVKQFPLEIHPHAAAAARMFEAVARQNPAAAYRLYDVLYTNQERLKAEGDAFIDEAARRAGADVARALADARSPAVAAAVTADAEEAKRLGFSGTPGFLVNGVPLQGSYPIATFESIISRQLAARSGSWQER